MQPNNSNGQGWQAPPEEVINGLINRIANLTMELAVKDAYIAKLEAGSRQSEPVLVEE